MHFLNGTFGFLFKLSRMEQLRYLSNYTEYFQLNEDPRSRKD